jgi:hypothetical protein
MTAKRLLIPLIAVVALLGSVVVGQATGWWQTSGRVPVNLANATVDDIRGSSTLSQVSDMFAIPQAELYTLLGLPADVSKDTKLKDLEAYIEVSVVRERVTAYLEGASQ